MPGQSVQFNEVCPRHFVPMTPGALLFAGATVSSFDGSQAILWSGGRLLVPKLFIPRKTYTREQFVADLYTAIIAGFIISALGGSRVQIGGPTGAFAQAAARSHLGLASRNTESSMTAQPVT